MIVLGLDVALRCTGYGLVQVDGKRFAAIDCGVIRNKTKDPLSECLRRLSGGVRQLIDTFHPDVAAIEGGFYFRNAKTAMVLGMARGAVVSLLAEGQILAYEYAPRRAKKAVVGHGGASKEQVAAVIATTLGLDVEDIPDDSTDALAVAVCHVLTASSANGAYLPDPL